MCARVCVCVYCCCGVLCGDVDKELSGWCLARTESDRVSHFRSRTLSLSNVVLRLVLHSPFWLAGPLCPKNKQMFKAQSRFLWLSPSASSISLSSALPPQSCLCRFYIFHYLNSARKKHVCVVVKQTVINEWKKGRNDRPPEGNEKKRTLYRHFFRFDPTFEEMATIYVTTDGIVNK